MKKDEEYLDFTDSFEIIDLNEEVDSKIDEMLDFFDTPSKEDNKKVNLVLNENEENKTILDDEENKLLDYKPSIKDLKIKDKRKKKIVKKTLTYSLIVMLFFFEVFIVKSGNILKDLRVFANDYKLIRIQQNNKYGFIDEYGEIMINPKYVYAEDFINDYAIVKNSSNNYFVINKGGKTVVSSDEYFSMTRSGDDIIVSKKTDDGLKYGILSSKLKVKTKLVYDSISYNDDCYTFVKSDTVGIINLDGKEVYNYKLNKGEDKSIDVVVSKTSEQGYNKYAAIKVNHSTFIVNINDGTVVTDATLNNVLTDENNVFYEIKQGVKNYKYILNNEVNIESDTYLSMSIPSIEAGIIKAYDIKEKDIFISTSLKNKIEKKLTLSDVSFGDKVFCYYVYDYKKRQNILNIVKNGELKTSVLANYKIEKPFKNGFATIKFDDDTFSYINEDGNIITDLRFIEAFDFDKYGHAIAKTSDGFGVIDRNGKVIIKFNNNEIKQASEDYKINNNEKNVVFYAVKKDSRYSLCDKNGKAIIKNKYFNNVTFDNLYPIIMLEDDKEDYLYNSKDKKKVKLTSSKANYKIFEKYILINKSYYNYYGDLIYKDR